MAGKRIDIEITGDATMHVEYSGFEGNQCFIEADSLKAALAAQGLDVEVIKVERKKDEVEVRRLPNSTSVGA